MRLSCCFVLFAILRSSHHKLVSLKYLPMWIQYRRKQLMFPFLWLDPDCVEKAIRRVRNIVVPHFYGSMLAHRFNHLSTCSSLSGFVLGSFITGCAPLLAEYQFEKKPITERFRDDNRKIIHSRLVCTASIRIIFMHSKDSLIVVSTHAVKEIVYPLLSSLSSSSNRWMAMKTKRRGEGDHDENVALRLLRWEPKLLEEFSSTLEEIASSSIRESKNEDHLRLDFSLNPRKITQPFLTTLFSSIWQSSQWFVRFFFFARIDIFSFDE